MTTGARPSPTRPPVEKRPQTTRTMTMTMMTTPKSTTRQTRTGGVSKPTAGGVVVFALLVAPVLAYLLLGAAGFWD